MLELQRKISVAQRDRDLGLVADLRYNALPEVQHRLEQVCFFVFGLCAVWCWGFGGPVVVKLMLTP